MRSEKYILYKDIIHSKNVRLYRNVKNITIQRFLKHYYDAAEAIKLKPEYERLRLKDYRKALDFWKEHFPGVDYYYVPIDHLDDPNISPFEVLQKYPEYALTCYPNKEGDNYIPEENEIYIKWYMERYLESSPRYNFELQREIIEEDLKRSTNKIGYIEKTLQKTLQEIDFQFLGKPSEDGKRELHFTRTKLSKNIFEDLDDRGMEPDWKTAGKTTVYYFIHAKYLIQFRGYLENKLGELKNGKSYPIIEEEVTDEPGKWNLRQRYLLLQETDMTIKSLFKGNTINQKAKEKLISNLLNCDTRTARELLGQTRQYTFQEQDYSKVKTFLQSIKLNKEE